MNEVESPKRYRMIECQDCGGLDTYGNEEYAEIGRQHARETGHYVVMWVEYRIDINEERAPASREIQPAKEGS